MEPSPGKVAVTVNKLPLEALFRTMTCTLDALLSASTNRRVRFCFPDTAQCVRMHVRNGVCETRIAPLEERDTDHNDPATPRDFTVVCNEQTWRDIVAGASQPALLVATGQLSVCGSGGIAGFGALFSLFVRP